MVISTDSIWEEVAEGQIREVSNAIVYADRQQETVLHEGAIRMHANGWIELPTGRLLSPSAVHHIDTQNG